MSAAYNIRAVIMHDGVEYGVDTAVTFPYTTDDAVITIMDVVDHAGNHCLEVQDAPWFEGEMSKLTGKIIDAALDVAVVGAMFQLDHSA